MFNRIMVANRGEIALRILRACREMGIETVAVFSEADADAAYLDFANEAICIGPAQPAASYLNVPNIISAAEIMNVEAIHPGYGFLAENSHFADVCNECGITFIGPSPEAIASLGNKTKARNLARTAGVPVIPGSEEAIDDEGRAIKLANKIGYPVLVKASAGGGGRGMRLASTDVSLVNAIHGARAEADAAFKDSSVYLEKYLTDARHIEFQIFADNHGNIVHLGERDCSLQRRHQKLVEESPSTVMTERKRGEIGDAAKKLVKAAEYTNAGTVEFLVDRDMNYYFMEMNSRIQVEHPVTEMVTGYDLVRMQIEIAAGERLKLKQKNVKIRGHAIECRINAEDPGNGFKPSPGTITELFTPGGPDVRVDSHVYAGYTIPSNYDSLIAKLIVRGSDRGEAITKMRGALSEFRIEGIKTTVPFLLEIFGHTRYLGADVNTRWIESYMSESRGR